MERKIIEKRKSGHGYRYIMKCLYCGKEFEIMGFEFNHGVRKFCSRECYYKAMEEKPELIFGKKRCIQCGEEFSPTAAAQKYCSRKCRLRAMQEKYHRENPSTYYQDGSSVKWERNRQRAFVRDNFTCQDCGEEEDIEVHHKDGTGSNRPSSAMNNDLDNLVTLCHQCHLQRHADKGDLKVPSEKSINKKERNAYIVELCEEYSQTDVAKMFGLTRQRIHQIVNKYSP